MEFRGVVLDGVGQAKTFTQLEWVREQVRAKIGFDPYPGTLNLRVKDADALWACRAGPGILIVPGAAGYCAARCYRMQVGGVPAAWILPEVPGYPEDVVELLAPVSLRQTLNLNTGVTVTVCLESGLG